MEKKKKKKYEVIYLPGDNLRKLPTFDTKEEGYAFIDGLTWNCKISPDKHPCESCNAEFDVFETEQPLESISEETRPTGEEELREIFRKKFVGKKNGQDVWWVDNPWRVFDWFREQLSQAREEGYQSGCEDMLKDTCAKIRLFVESESGKSGRKEILKFIASLTNKDKVSEVKFNQSKDEK